jgi:type VI secretion system protein ImpH
VAPAERAEGSPVSAEAGRDDAAQIDEARRRGFYPLVLLLERLAGGPPVGSAGDPAIERIRFRHDPSLAFPTGDVSEVRELSLPPEPGDAQGARRRGFEVVTTVLGLTGSVSPLPQYLVEELAQEDPDSPRMRGFLDIFHDRMLALLYRGRARRDFANGWRTDAADPWSPRLLSLLGVDTGSAEALPAVPVWQILRLAPLLAERTMTAGALEAAIEDALEAELGGARVAVEPFAGAWVPVAPEQLTRLGRKGRLGQDCLVGEHVLDVAGRFRVKIGPLTSAQYGRFADGEPVRRVEELVNALVSEPLEHEIVLWLAEEAAPALKLGASRLGKDAWLGGQRYAEEIRARRVASS